MKHISQFNPLVGVPKSVRERIISEAETIQRNIDTLVSRVADAYGIKARDIRGRSRLQTTNEARHVAMVMCRDLLGMSLTAIGFEFGRDHTTVLSNIAGFRRALKVDRELQSFVRENFPELMAEKAGAK